LSDYGKGVLSDRVINQLIARARDAGVAVIVDPKGNDYSRYRGASLVTPNRRELGLATDLPVGSLDDVEAAARALIAHAGITHVLVTLSQDGMMLVSEAGAPIQTVSATAREVFDVSGAGDTVVAALAAAVAADFDLSDAVRLANAAAGVVVAKTGTAVVSARELVATLQAAGDVAREDKILDHASLVLKLAEWRQAGHKIGFTNGCFDLLHPGHVSLFSQARGACDRLIVGLNSDASVTRLKGPNRPLNDQHTRSVVLAALAHIDGIIVFDEDTPAEIIALVMPDVLVKGADYTVETVVGADIVQAAGGRVLLANLEEGYSTTNMVAEITAKE
jgi:D-beta-D-heptose 7-phosphate kinase/D-beta-D-heptose 1-phosphate adenosyltransferase